MHHIHYMDIKSMDQSIIRGVFFKAAASCRKADVASTKSMERNRLLLVTGIFDCHFICRYTDTSLPCTYWPTPEIANKVAYLEAQIMLKVSSFRTFTV